MKKCKWVKFNEASDGSRAYKTECGCTFILKREEEIESEDICDCGKLIEVEK